MAEDPIPAQLGPYQLEVEAGERVVVGLNAYQEEEPEPRIEQPAFPELEARQRARLDEIRRRRDGNGVRSALKGLGQAARGEENLLPSIVGAVKLRATLGEISGVLRDAWGEYRPAS